MSESQEYRPHPYKLMSPQELFGEFRNIYRDLAVGRPEALKTADDLKVLLKSQELFLKKVRALLRFSHLTSYGQSRVSVHLSMDYLEERGGFRELSGEHSSSLPRLLVQEDLNIFDPQIAKEVERHDYLRLVRLNLFAKEPFEQAMTQRYGRPPDIIEASENFAEWRKQFMAKHGEEP